MMKKGLLEEQGGRRRKCEVICTSFHVNFPNKQSSVKIQIRGSNRAQGREKSEEKESHLMAAITRNSQQSR